MSLAHAAMTSRQLKAGYYVLEGLNAAATSYYFYYLFFYLQRHFGFGNSMISGRYWLTA